MGTLAKQKLAVYLLNHGHTGQTEIGCISSKSWAHWPNRNWLYIFYIMGTLAKQKLAVYLLNHGHTGQNENCLKYLTISTMDEKKFAVGLLNYRHTGQAGLCCNIS